MIPRKAITFSQPSTWVRRHLGDFEIGGFPLGACVLDVGCGYGQHLETMQAAGIDAVGIDPEPEAVAYCRSLDLRVQSGCAEDLPFPDASFDGVILNGVLQFTDPCMALAEAHRVIRSGGEVLIATHGVGYALHVMLARKGTGRFYGARMILSTLWLALTGSRVGDTICFSRRRLNLVCERAGFSVDSSLEGRRYFGLPVFIYARARRS